MAGLIKPLNSVYDQFRRLPGVGNKSALRLAYHIIDMPEEEVRRLAETLLQAKREIRFCKECFNLTDSDVCEICADTGRDHSMICVVEQPQDAMAMERSHGYTGVYHVLHGCLSPLDGIGPENLRIKELLFRLEKEDVKEVILATNSNVEGEATASYLAQLLRHQPVMVSRIARGLPMGGDLEYADEVTLAKALENRTPIKE
ncbi:MAG: recombination protein RecR [Acidaminococcaceae bacterium]|jgi:recombination protein RecR|uniref:Recombination protein RecR n=1 Tax=Succiniclasticum ruminis TaxID=40841 RepID=A0A1G6KDT3_9FIRM|nr:recombination mediator RecR [Succiniclasticum ruminis]MBQ6424328.1 recombination protein RecR [Acidaminococcaceae bacterium]MBQ6429395.1 recombination protein RecR [Acidaminococcaceae bacterium]MBQ6744608.1 recombination protein RecR [Acidaminococcaceae bacterium]MBQ6779021.1 recombination protein RecR [Acidaminococcaceae bacterium]MBQ8699994.1 recombination protein RecR [Acidaminococcaceae bacterium]